MILEEERFQLGYAGVEIVTITNPLYNRKTVQNYCRKYKVNRDGVDFLYSCPTRSNGCYGRGYLEWFKPDGLKLVTSCPCIDKVLEKIK